MIDKYGKIIKRCIFFTIIAVAILFSIFIMVRYEEIGEKDLPFYIEKILVVSTVDGKQNVEAENTWNLNLKQNNDLFVYIKKDEQKKEVLKKVTIENFHIVQAPKVGELKVYRPTGELSNLYSQSEQNYIDTEIEYKGGTIDDLKQLEISNQGGILGIRIANENIGTYVSDNDEEIAYDGSLLTKAGIEEKNIEFCMEFDIIIEIQKNIKYKGTVKLNCPIDDLIQKGNATGEIKNFDNVVFKRI